MNRQGFFTLLLVALSGSSAWADGLIRDGIGAISTGRGGTNIAHSDNGVVLLDNPAGIANMSVSGMFEIGVDAVFTDLDYSDPQNAEVNNDFWPCGAPHVTYARKSCDGIWAYGIGVYAPAGFAAKYDMTPQPPLAGTQLYKSIGLMGKILPGVAVRLNDQLTVGATLGLGVCHVELEGPFNIQTGPLAGLPTLFDLQTTGTTVVGSVGLQYQISPQTMLGLTYTEESRFTLDGSVRATTPVPLPLPTDFDAQFDITWPRSAGVGIKHDLNCEHRVSCDVIWYNWSEAFDSFGIRLSNPLVGTIPDVFAMNWEDTVSVRLGYEWMANCRDVWRLGYVFHDDPVPNGTLNPYTDGVLEHAFAAGLSRRYSRCLLSLAYQYSFSPERTVGASDLVGGDFSNSTFQAQAHWASASVLVPF